MLKPKYGVKSELILNLFHVSLSNGVEKEWNHYNCIMFTKCRSGSVAYYLAIFYFPLKPNSFSTQGIATLELLTPVHVHDILRTNPLSRK